MRGVLSGLVAGFALVAALHFRLSAKKTGDVFFDLFAAAFVLFAVNSVAVGVVRGDDAGVAVLYLIRLLAFVIILVAVWHKNRR